MSISLTINKTIKAPAEKVYQAWTDPDVMCRWFAPGPMTVAKIECDPQVGGHYEVHMQSEDGTSYITSGQYIELVRNEKLVFTWQWRDSDLVTQVTVALRQLADETTELTLIHEGFVDQDACDEHAEGWNGCFAKLPDAIA